MKQERIFQAIGGADPALLERSEGRRKSRRGWYLAAGALAACAALVLALGRANVPVTPPEPEIQPPQEAVQSPPEEVRTTPLRLAGQEGGTLHLLAVRCGAAPQATEREFILYFNQEMYQGAWEDGVYTVRPLTPLPEDLPACELTVEHLKNRSPSQAAEERSGAMAAEYGENGGICVDLDTGRYSFRCSDGSVWNDKQAMVWCVDDRQGGSYVLTARFFLEAEEGHGVRFADMVSTFEPLAPDVAQPAWMTSLRQAAGTLVPAILSGRWTEEAEALLAEGASISGYGRDVSAEAAIVGLDFTVDDSEDPIEALVSVRLRVSTEEGYDYLTLEMTRDSGQWLLNRAGIET